MGLGLEPCMDFYITLLVYMHFYWSFQHVTVEMCLTFAEGLAYGTGHLG